MSSSRDSGLTYPWGVLQSSCFGHTPGAYCGRKRISHIQSPQKESSKIEPGALTLAVEGMSCGHCKLAIVGEASRVSGVDWVEVDLETKLVHVRGRDVDDGAVVTAIDEAGYEAVAA